MRKLFMFPLRLLLLLAGLLFAASLLLGFLLLVSLWTLRYLWAKLTGQPVLPFVMRVDPRAGFSRMYRAGQQQSGNDAGSATMAPRVRTVDVTDVEPKVPRG